MEEEKKFSFFSFILIVINIALILLIGIGIAYGYNYMNKNDISIKEGIKELEVSLKTGVNKIINAEPGKETPLEDTEDLEVFKKPVKPEKNVADYYFYNQLTENGKTMYNTIQGNLEKMKSGNYIINFGTAFNDDLQTEAGKEKLKVDFQAAWDALALDNPEIFFIDVTKLYLTIESSTLGDVTTCTTMIGPEDGDNYLVKGITTKKIDEYNQKLEKIKNNVISNTYGSDYERAKQIHDALVDTLEYDQTLNRLHTRDIYGALVEHDVVCEGYAKAYKYLLDAVGIPCVLVSGTGTNSKGETEEHIWNYVLLGNNWYAVDVTWDDPIMIGGTLTDTIKYKYFLKGSQDFNGNHKANNYISNNTFRFEYPKLNRNSY